MTWETLRNFLIGGVVLLSILGLAVYSKVHTEPSCGPGSDVMLALLDYTDPVGSDARATLKDAIWTAVEKSPANTHVVLRMILGTDAPHGRRMVVPDRVMCRPQAPSIMDGTTGSLAKPRMVWRRFKDQLCGASPAGTAPDDDSLLCSDLRRGPSFFEQVVPASHSSPVVEEVTDAVRRYLPPSVARWRLIVASDWREYSPPALDLEYHRCDVRTDPRRVARRALIGQSEKLLRGTGTAEGNNEVDGFLVLRSDMTPSEADCLAQVEDEFFRESAASPPPELRFQRLPVTQRSATDLTEVPQP
jgi:hypothetical protein